MKRCLHLALLAALMSLIGLAALAPSAEAASGQGNMYEEFDGIMLFYTTTDMITYRELLPEVFDLPDEPLVEVFVIDYYKMASWALEPYLEVAVFLLAKHKGQEIWHCITMPVTSERARLGGINRLGYPKVLAEVALDRNAPVFSGTLKTGGKTLLEVTLDTKDRTVTTKEKEWFDRLTGIPSLNILRGRLLDPMPGARKAKINMLELSSMYPDTFKVQVGKATLVTHPEAAPKDNGWRPKAFAVEVKEIVLAYYFQNKYGFSFGQTKIISD